MYLIIMYIMYLSRSPAIDDDLLKGMSVPVVVRALRYVESKLELNLNLIELRVGVRSPGAAGEVDRIGGAKVEPVPSRRYVYRASVNKHHSYVVIFHSRPRSRANILPTARTPGL